MFKDVGSKDDALLELQNLMQGKQSVDKPNMKFSQKANMDKQENATLLINMYTRVLNERIAKRILVSGFPAMLITWINKASELDEYKQWAKNLFANALVSKKTQWKPKYNQGEPMNIECSSTFIVETFLKRHS